MALKLCTQEMRERKPGTWMIPVKRLSETTPGILPYLDIRHVAGLEVVERVAEASCDVTPVRMFAVQADLRLAVENEER